MNSEEIIVALAIKYQGDWIAIEKALRDTTDRDLDEYLEIAINSDYNFITILSPDYPSALRNEYMPPFVLFYHGDINLLKETGKNIAVVGSRECTEYGVNMTQSIVKGICSSYNIVSGMARGIDAVAHETAIKNGGKTIAVLGGGIDYIYPPSNRHLYEKMKGSHLIISEYPGNTIPQPDWFPRRNRIIAMISCGTIVTEAYSHSGTLTTVMYTLQAQRLLFCVPYLATAESECNRLIAEGAYLVENSKQVLEILKNDNHI